MLQGHMDVATPDLGFLHSVQSHKEEGIGFQRTEPDAAVVSFRFHCLHEAGKIRGARSVFSIAGDMRSSKDHLLETGHSGLPELTQHIVEGAAYRSSPSGGNYAISAPLVTALSDFDVGPGQVEEIFEWKIPRQIRLLLGACRQVQERGRTQRFDDGVPVVSWRYGISESADIVLRVGDGKATCQHQVSVRGDPAGSSERFPGITVGTGCHCTRVHQDYIGSNGLFD